MMIRCHQCNVQTDQETVCHICKHDHMAEFEKKREIQSQRSLEMKQRLDYLTNGVYPESHNK